MRPVVVASVVLLIGVAPLGARSALAVQITDTRRLTNDASDQFSPVISGNYVVFTDTRNGNADVYLYDLTTGLETNITNRDANQYLNDVHGDFVVYSDFSGATAQIYAYYIPSGVACQLTFASTSQLYPSIGNGIVAYQMQNGSDAEIGTFDLSVLDTTDFAASCSALAAGQVSGDAVLPLGPGRQLTPKTSGAWVLYQGFNAGGGARVFAYNRLTQAHFQMPEHDGKAQLMPELDGAHAVYVEDDGVARNVSYFDLDTETFVQLTADANRQSYPAISGNYIAWEDSRDGNLDVYLHDFATGVTQPLTSDPYNQYMNSIDGNRVVFTDASAGNLDIVMVTFAMPGGEEPPPPPPSPCTREGEGSSLATLALDDEANIARREYIVWPFLDQSITGGSSQNISDHERITFDVQVAADEAQALISTHLRLVRGVANGRSRAAALRMRVNGVERLWQGDDSDKDGWVDATFATPVPLFAGHNLVTLEGPGYGTTYEVDRRLEAAAGATLSVSTRPACAPNADIAAACLSDSDVLYGPVTFVRRTGKPVSVPFNYSAGDGGPALICILNGDGEGLQRVSAGVVTHNGEEAVGPRAFSQATVALATGVRAQAENQGSVELRSAPGSFMQMKIVRDPRPQAVSETVVVRAPASSASAQSSVIASLQEAAGAQGCSQSGGDPSLALFALAFALLRLRRRR